MPQVTEPHIIAIAKAAAFVERGNHTYLPQTIEERDAFVPPQLGAAGSSSSVGYGLRTRA